MGACSWDTVGNMLVGPFRLGSVCLECFGSVPVGTMLGRVAGPAFYCRKVAECAYGTALGACRRDWVGTGLGLGCL